MKELLPKLMLVWWKQFLAKWKLRY